MLWAIMIVAILIYKGGENIFKGCGTIFFFLFFIYFIYTCDDGTEEEEITEEHEMSQEEIDKALRDGEELIKEKEKQDREWREYLKKHPIKEQKDSDR